MFDLNKKREIDRNLLRLIYPCGVRKEQRKHDNIQYERMWKPLIFFTKHNKTFIHIFEVTQCISAEFSTE